MTPQEIINEAQLLGVRIILNPSGGLSLVGNTSVVTESFKATVTENRQQIIDYLKTNAPLPAGINPEAQPSKRYTVGQNNMVFFAVTGPTTYGPRPSFGLTSASAGIKFPADLFTPISSPLKRLGLSGGVTPDNVVNTFNGATGNVVFTVNGSTGSIGVSTGSTFNVDVVSTFNGATGTIEGVNTFNGATGTIEGVNTFNGATGSIIGVHSVNGQTGAVTLVDLIGVSSLDGTTGDITTDTGLTLNGQTLGIDSTSVITVGGVTTSGTINATTINMDRTTISDRIVFPNGQIAQSIITTVNGASGDVQVVSSLNGDTGAIEGVNTFNGNTGTIEGVASVNGATGAVTNIAAINATNLFSSNQEFAGSVAVSGGISLQTSGITFPDGTHQSTAMRAGLKYTVTSGTPSAGQLFVSIDLGGVVDSLSLHDTDANGNDISGTLTLFASNGGYIQILKEDGSALIAIAVDAGETDTATFASDKLAITQIAGGSQTGFETEDQAPSSGDTVYVDVIPNLVSAVQTIGGFQGNIQITPLNAIHGLTINEISFVPYLGIDETQRLRTAGISTNGGICFPDGSHLISGKEVAQFTIQSSSGIAADEKLDALKFIPFNATVKEVGLRTSITGGVTASFVQAGTDPFGAATTGARTLATIELGQTGNDFGFTSATISSSAITGGSFVYLDIDAISGGITGVQAFMTFEGT